MQKLIIFIMFLLITFSATGCTLHFKSDGLELDAERQRIQKDTSYHLSGMDFAKLLHWQE